VNTRLEEFSYLRKGLEPDWTLLKFYASLEKEPAYLIVDTKTKRALLVGDDTLYECIKKTMLDQKVRIISSL
jgi:hypothetical protein